MNKKDIKILLLSCLGGVLEFFDFIVFAFLAATISDQVFASGNSLVNLISIFGTYAIGYIFRPIGGIIFGHFGDRYGRRKAFLASILLIAFASLGIAFLPTYRQVGLVSPLLLTFFRLVQGFSIGGEIPGAITYVSEKLANQRGFACGVIFFSINLGTVIAASHVALLHAFLTSKQLALWGWRIPFLLGGGAGLISFFYRRQLSDSSHFTELGHEVCQHPFLMLMKKHKKETFYGFMLVGVHAMIITLFFVFIPSYLKQVVNHFPSHFMWYYALATLIFSFGNIIAGYYSDKISHVWLVFLWLFVTALVAYPIYFIYAFWPQRLYFSLFLGVLPASIAAGLAPRLLADFFPTKVRYSGVATCYSLGFAIFGGLTPLLASWLIYYSNKPHAPAWIVIIFTGLVACLSSLKSSRSLLATEQ